MLWKLLPSSPSPFQNFATFASHPLGPTALMHTDFRRGFSFFIPAFPVCNFSTHVSYRSNSIALRLLILLGSRVLHLPAMAMHIQDLDTDISACGLQLLPLTLSDSPLSVGRIWIADEQSMPFPLPWELIIQQDVSYPQWSRLHSLQALAPLCLGSC